MIVTLILLTAYSCIAIYAATYGKKDLSIPSHAWMKQMIYGIIGFVAMWVLTAYDYRSLRKIHWWLYGITTFLLVAVYAFHPINGARSWIPLPGFSLQPSEFSKLAIVITLATMMAERDESEFPDYRLHTTWPMLLVVIVPTVLTLKEPALGQALVMLSIFAVMFMMFVRRSWFALGITIFVLISIVFIALPVEFPVQATAFVQNVLIKHNILHGYQANRILTWLDHTYLPLGAGYNIRQAQTAIGSGQLFGEGWLSGLETSSGGVPNQWTDYIFTAIGEEFGFIGSSLLVLLFLILVYRLVRAAGSSQDTYGTYLVMGIVGMFSFQVFENIGMDMYLSPSTGITLPFISYGGSSMLANFLATGIAMSVLLRKKRLSFS